MNRALRQSVRLTRQITLRRDGVYQVIQRRLQIVFLRLLAIVFLDGLHSASQRFKQLRRHVVALDASQHSLAASTMLQTEPFKIAAKNRQPTVHGINIGHRRRRPQSFGNRSESRPEPVIQNLRRHILRPLRGFSTKNA